jgi:hypothetical protein
MRPLLVEFKELVIDEFRETKYDWIFCVGGEEFDFSCPDGDVPCVVV